MACAGQKYCQSNVYLVSIFEFSVSHMARFIFLAVKKQLKNANVVLPSQDVHRQRKSGGNQVIFKEKIAEGKNQLSPVPVPVHVETE